MDIPNTTQIVSDGGNGLVDRRLAPAPFSYQTFIILDICILSVATGAFATFGVFSNIINIIVFSRQGILSSSTNVNLSGLALSDFITCLSMLLRALTLWFMYFSENGARPSTAFSLSIVSSYLPDVSLQMTCWITAITAFERVISVLFPFKVKRIFTPHRSLATLSIIFVALFVLNTPALLRGYLAWEIHPVTNQSYLELHYSQIYSAELYKYYTILIPSALKFTTIAVVLVCNIILFWQVSLSQKFRQTSSAGALTSKTSKSAPCPSTGTKTSDEELRKEKKINVNSNVDVDNTKVKPTSSKETKLLRMITVISFAFTLCNVWEIPTNVLFNFVLEFNVGFHYFQMYVTWSVAAFTWVVNSSTNIIIYYNMSTRYKETFNALFNRK